MVNLAFGGWKVRAPFHSKLCEAKFDVSINSNHRRPQIQNDTTISCGHEYTLSNVKFALSINPDNQDLQQYAHWVEHQEKEHRPTIPTKLVDQIKCNPFLQCDHEHFQKLYKSTDPIEVFGLMRKAKDNF